MDTRVDEYLRELRLDRDYAEAFGISLLRYRELKRKSCGSDEIMDMLIAWEINRE